ncbi:MAG: hypothetical protein GQ467_03775, partial [Mariprofundaceae bacterium]|nr:hypothetical protein [Mariprofundaceae bacterium]
GFLAGNGVKQADAVGVALDRAYLTAKYQFDDVWSMRLTTDATVDTALSKQTNVYIKYAYLRGKLSDAFAVDAGVIETPWIGYENKLNTHRYVYKSFTDFEKFDDSADAGLGVFGKLGDGLFQYALAGVNGGGYSKIAKTAAIDFNSRLGFYPIEGLTFDLQFRDGYKGTKKWDVATLANTPGTKYRLMQGMVTYGIGNNFRIAANYISQNADDKTTGLTTKSTGYDAWGYYNFNSDFGVFGQYDYLKDKKDATLAEVKVNRLTAGLEYTPRKNVRFSLVAKTWKIKNATFNQGAEIKNATYGLYSEVKF